ncbi:MAG: phosphate ABC transporter permease PstA, partial [Candidatus Rokuibacteriota bacterium]
MSRLWKSGEPFIWLTGGALAVALLMVIGLVALILYNGLGFFWPSNVLRVTLTDGTVMTGQLADRELVPGRAAEHRVKLKVGNRDIYGADFRWVDESRIVKRAHPAAVAVIERTEWGVLIGPIKELRDGGRVLARGAEARAEVARRLPEVTRIRREIRRIETREIGGINYQQEQVRLGLKGLELEGITSGPEVEALKAKLAPLQEQYKGQEARLADLRKTQTASILVEADGGQEKEWPLAQIVDVRFPNTMGVPAKSAYYLGRIWEFVSDEPREANTEGGVFPAIFGTVMMVVIMSIL